MNIKIPYLNNISLEEKFIIDAIPVNYDIAIFNYFSDLDTNKLLNLSKINLVESIVAFRLIEHIGEKKISKEWIDCYKIIHNKITLYLKELDRVAGLFFNHDIPLIALKNSGIVRGLYQFPGLVPMGDVDTLVKRSDFIKAHTILINNGYKLVSPDKYHVADEKIGYRTGGSEYKTLLSDGSQLWFELQWRPVEGRFLRPDQEPDGDLLIDRSLSLNNTKVRILSPEDNLLQVCLHTAKHSYVRAPGFRLHLDVDRITNFQKINWEVFLENVFFHKVQIPTFFSLSIPKTLFNTEIPRQVLKEINPNIIKVYFLTKWIRNIGLLNPNEKKFGKIGYIVWTILLYDSLYGFFKALFPDKEWMINQYLIKNNKYLLYYYFKRILELIFKRVKT